MKRKQTPILEVESWDKPEIRLTDDGNEDFCIELKKAEVFLVDSIYKGKVKIYFARGVLK